MSKEYDVASHPRLIEQRQKRRRVVYRRIILFICFFVTFVFGLSYFSAHPRVTISTIKIDGNRVVSASKIEELVIKKIQGRYVYLFKKSNVFIYPKNKIIKDLKNEFARIKDVEISTNQFTNLSIKVSERVGLYLWCGEQINEEDTLNEDCYFINDEGYIFDKAPFFSGNIYFKFYSPLNDKEREPLGNSSLDPETIKDIFAFSDALEEMSFSVAMIDMNDASEYKLYLKRNSSRYDEAGSIKLPQIIFKKEDKLEEILNNFSSSMKQEKFTEEVVGRYSSLEYIDLRYKNKVLYKHEGE